MATMSLDKQQSVYLLTLQNGDQQNALNKTVLEEYLEIFDEIESDQNNASLIIRSDHTKTFCNGLDLAWLMQQSIEEKKSLYSST